MHFARRGHSDCVQVGVEPQEELKAQGPELLSIGILLFTWRLRPLRRWHALHWALYQPWLRATLTWDLGLVLVNRHWQVLEKNLDGRVSWNNCLQAEILWVLKVVTSNCSYRSSVGTAQCQLFQRMFLDSDIAQSFACSERKWSFGCIWVCMNILSLSVPPGCRERIFQEAGISCTECALVGSNWLI